jgi:hypothetical protein
MGRIPIRARPQDTVLPEYRPLRSSTRAVGLAARDGRELGRVLGMVPGVLGAIRPDLTLFGPPQPTASSAVIPCHSARRGCPGPALLPRLNRLRIVLTAWITATAFGPNPRVPRLAVIVLVGVCCPSVIRCLLGAMLVMCARERQFSAMPGIVRAQTEYF